MGLVTIFNQAVKSKDVKSFDEEFLEENGLRIVFNKGFGCDDSHIATLFECLKEFVFTYHDQEIDYDLSFKNLGLDFDDYVFEDSYFQEETDDDLIMIYREIETGEKLELSYDNHLVFKNVEYPALILKTLWEHKGLYKDSFFKWSKLDDFIETDDDFKRHWGAVVFVATDAGLFAVKTQFEKDAPIQKIKSFEKGQFIEFSW